MAATAAVGITSMAMDDFSSYEFLLRKGPDQFLSTSDQCVNTAQRHFDTRGVSRRIDAHCRLKFPLGPSAICCCLMQTKVFSSLTPGRIS